jgi:glycine reductase complex component B subunit gamma
VPTRGIPFPAGDPDVSRDQELAWRRQLLNRALRAVETSVTEPTVFDTDPA